MRLSVQNLIKARHTKHRPCRFCTLFFEVLPITDDASVVNSKTSKKSMQNRRGGFWCVKNLISWYSFNLVNPPVIGACG